MAGYPRIESYTAREKHLLLDLARRVLTAATTRQPLPTLDLEKLPLSLRALRACFVTLRFREDGRLRGCTGTLVARRPLAEEVAQMTIQTAFNDPRFPPVSGYEVPALNIEISVLTPPVRLEVTGPDDLLARLRPGIDGVTLKFEGRRATFLPQVWDSYPDPPEFLDLLAGKMGAPASAWRDPRAEIEVYQAIVFEEGEVD